MATTTVVDRVAQPNGTLEVHTICRDCASGTGLALCGSRLIGILLPPTPVTCPVCPEIKMCSTCGRTRP